MGMVGIISVMHASVGVFWPKGYEQGELYSRLNLIQKFTLLSLSCVECVKIAYTCRL